MKILPNLGLLLLLVGGFILGYGEGKKHACLVDKIGTLKYVYMFRAKGFSEGDQWECKEVCEDDFKEMYHTDTARECIEMMLGGER